VYREIIIGFLRSIGRQYQVRGIEISTSCLNPDHADQNPSFSINTKTGMMGCFSCGYKNHISNLVEEGSIDPDMERTALYLESIRALEDVEEDDEATFINLLPPMSPIEVKPFRGLSQKTIDDAGLYYCNLGRYAGRIIFPLESGFDARIMPLDNTKPRVPDAKYLRPVTFKTAKHMYIQKPEEYSDTLVVCEGVFDSLSFKELGYAAGANFGLLPCSPDKAGEIYAEGFTKVANGFDNDEKGLQGWQRVKESFRQYFEIVPPLDIIKKINAANVGDVNDYLIYIKDKHVS